MKQTNAQRRAMFARLSRQQQTARKKVFERCVKDVKGQPGYNPYAVCRVSTGYEGSTRHKRMKNNKLQLFVDRAPNGSIVVSAFVGPQLVHRNYIGYSLAEAKRRFREEIKR